MLAECLVSDLRIGRCASSTLFRAQHEDVPRRMLKQRDDENLQLCLETNVQGCVLR
jgi:energy-converting hydrogenase A subunit M